jgi:hypothetical protein
MGGGLLLPTLDYADHHDPGWIVSGGLWRAVGDGGLGLFGEGFYASTKFAPEEADDEETQSMFGAFAGATYRLGDPEEKGLFLVGKAGFLNRDSDLEVGDDETETQFAGGGGVGFIIPGESASPWILAQFIMGKCTKFFTIGVGLTFGGRTQDEG